MTKDTQSMLGEFFARYAKAVSSRNPSGFTEEHFDRSLLCPSDRTLPFDLLKADQRVLARSEQQRLAKSGPHAVSFEIRDMVGGLPGQMPGHLYVTVAWHLDVRPLAEKSGDQVVIGYLLRIEDERIDILAASVLDAGLHHSPRTAQAEEDDEPLSQDGLAAGHGNGGAGHIAG